MMDEMGYGAAVSEDGRTIGVYIDNTVTAFFRTERPIALPVWHEILMRHFSASLELPESQADGWMGGALQEVHEGYGGGAFRRPKTSTNTHEWALVMPGDGEG